MTKGNRIILHLATSLLAFGLLNFSGHAAPMSYCLVYGNGGTNCGFASRSQCEASAPVKPRNAPLTNWGTVATIKHYPGLPFSDLTRWNPTSPAEPSISAGL